MVASLLGGCWYHTRKLPEESRGSRMDCLECWALSDLIDVDGIRDLVDAQRIVIGLLVQESASARQHVNDLLDRVNELEVRAAGE